MKNIIKKTVCLCIVLLQVVCIAACGGKENEAEKASSQDSNVAVDRESANEVDNGKNGLNAETNDVEVNEENIGDKEESEQQEPKDNEEDEGEAVPDVNAEEEKPKPEKETMSDAEKVAVFVKEKGGVFSGLFDGLYGDMASASVSAKGTSVIISISFFEYSSEDYKKQSKVNVGSVVDSAMSSRNVVGAIRSLEPAVSSVLVAVYGNDGVQIFSNSYS